MHKAESVMALPMLLVFDMNIKISNRRLDGMTLVEALVVMVLLAVLVTMVLPAMRPVHSKAPRISCINNLIQIGIA